MTMRTLAGLATVVICAGAAGAAGAQTLVSKPDPAATDMAAVLNQAAFAPQTSPQTYASRVDPAAMLLGHEAYEPGAGVVRWSTDQVKLSNSIDGPIDSLRISVGGALRTPLGLPASHGAAQFDAQAYEVALTRDWPGAVSFDGKTFGFDFSPHAGFGVGNQGGSAEAGAMVQVSKRGSLSETAAERLKALGLRDGARFGDRGRFYLYAAASGRAVGLNMLRNDAGTSWDRAWSQDATSTLVGDAQVGVGWRKGPIQTSFGYLHRETNAVHNLYGVDAPKADDMVAFSLSIKPPAR
jgi:hypothetical protein